MRWARFKALLAAAASGALSSPLRSLLAALSMAAGTAALIGFLAVDEGNRSQQARQIDSLGENLIIVRPAAGGELTIEDAHALTDTARLPAVRLVAPELRLPTEMAFEGLTANVTVLGTTPEYFAMRGLALRTGRFITEQDHARAAPVAVVGEGVRDLLFPNVSRSPRPAALNGRPVSVVGYLERAAGTANAPLDRTVLVPLDTLRLKLTGGARNLPLTAIGVQAADAASLEDAAAQVAETLEQRVGDLRFTVTSQADMRTAFRDAADDYRALLGVLAGVGLGLAAVVMFSATTASASARRVELAVRRAAGAREGDVARLLVAEAALLAALGGALGAGVGVYAAGLFPYLAVAEQSFPLIVRGYAPLAAVAAAVVVGAAAALYPAWRASRLDPLATLRRR